MSDLFKVPGICENPVQNIVAICQSVSYHSLNRFHTYRIGIIRQKLSKPGPKPNTAANRLQRIYSSEEEKSNHDGHKAID